MIKQMPTKKRWLAYWWTSPKPVWQAGWNSGLFRPGAPIARDFYSELPIAIQVVGKYEELSLFVSGLAALPRIVTVHDVKIAPVGKDDTMLMDATVKTYNEQLTASASALLKTKDGD